MNCKEHTKALSEENLQDENVLMLKLKIQRLEEEDFFVSISGKGLITHLKEKIVTFLKAAEVSDEDVVGIGVTSLRLIYKGMVLLDAKSIEFYKIQNDDTIQLCPLRRKKQRQQAADVPRSVPNGDRVAAGALEEEPGEENAGRETNQFTFISFSMSDNPIDLLAQRSHIRSRGRGVDSPDNSGTHAQGQGQGRRGRARIQRLSNSSFRGRPSPATISGTLRNFKLSLEQTLRRVSSTNIENRRDLIPELDALITQANSLRDELQADEHTPPMLPSPMFEILLLERLGAAPRSNNGSRAPGGEDEEKQDISQAQLPPSPELIPFRNESIDIASDLSTPSLRYPPLRVNTGAVSEFPPVAAEQITPPQALRGTMVTFENDTVSRTRGLPRNANRGNEREPQPQRPSRSRNIFSSIISRFNRR